LTRFVAGVDGGIELAEKVPKRWFAAHALVFGVVTIPQSHSRSVKTMLKVFEVWSSPVCCGDARRKECETAELGTEMQKGAYRLVNTG
jgi:hypothetical protein